MQRFWMDLFQKVLGVEFPAQHMLFEKRVRLEDSTRYIDVYIPETKVLVEQKGSSIDLSKPEIQSGGANPGLIKLPPIRESLIKVREMREKSSRLQGCNPIRVLLLSGC